MPRAKNRRYRQMRIDELSNAISNLENRRKQGSFESALPLAEGQAKADLQWMIKTESLMKRRPVGIQDRLTNAERKRLGQAMRLPRPKKKRLD